jgi:hypothetical protein
MYIGHLAPLGALNCYYLLCLERSTKTAMEKEALISDPWNFALLDFRQNPVTKLFFQVFI